MTLALYVPRASPVHRAPAWVELLVLAAGSVVLFVLSSWPVVLGGLVLVLLVGLGLARLPAGVLLAQARAVAWFLAAVLVVHVLVDGWREGLDDGGLAVVRLLVLVLAAAVVTATCRVAEMVAVVEAVCAPLRVLGVRPARIGLLVALALRFVPVLGERAARIREAQAARGGATRGPRALARTAVPLLVQLLVLAHTLAEALDARGADAPAEPVRRRRRPRRPASGPGTPSPRP